MDIKIMEDISRLKLLDIDEYEQLKNDSLELQSIKNGKNVSYKRHIVKAISYRALGTLQTCLISYFFTGSFVIAGSVGATEILLKPFMYFLHERAWYKFSNFGVKQIKKD
jgi:uncharacterized membrane protein